MLESLMEGLHVLVAVSIILIIMCNFYLLLKVIDWFYNAKEYDDKKLIKKVIDETKKDNK